MHNERERVSPMSLIHTDPNYAVFRELEIKKIYCTVNIPASILVRDDFANYSSALFDHYRHRLIARGARHARA